MRGGFDVAGGNTVEFAWHELTGAVGDSVTVLPIVGSVAILTDLSLAVMLLWFGLFQVVWGLYYDTPISVEPMKALAALVIAGSITTGELVLAGLLLGGGLLVLGATDSLARLSTYIGSPVVRGVQFGVALVLLETGVTLGIAAPRVAGLAAVLALVCIAAGYWTLTAVVVLVAGGVVAVAQTGLPTPTLPPVPSPLATLDSLPATIAVVEATLGQFAMTVGNAALAASVLLADYFDRDISPDNLSSSMGVMNLAAVPLGAMPMCHGSGGIAGKYAFGARTAGANLVLGLGYAAVALLAVDLMATYPTAVLGVVLALIALQLAWTALRKAESTLLVLAVGAVGLLTNLGVAFVAGLVAVLGARRLRGEPFR